MCQNETYVTSTLINTVFHLANNKKRLFFIRLISIATTSLDLNINCAKIVPIQTYACPNEF